MPRPLRKADPRVARLRRETALARAELRGPSTPRVAPAGLTSFPMKQRDPAVDQMVADFLAKRGGR
jgi:hypothetical protein